MKDLGALFSSAARTNVLRALYYQPESIGLRSVARLASIHPRSAELALASLKKDGLVKQKRITGQKLYRLNRRHPDTPLLTSIFKAAEHAELIQNQAALSRRALRLLPFMREATRMMKKAKRSRHVT